MAEIDLRVENQIGVVTLSRPEHRNALTLSMWRDLTRIFRGLGDDPNIRVIVLTGAGDNFSVGADIAEFATVRATAQQSTEYEFSVNEASEAIAAAPKPVIAAISGYCLGRDCHLSIAYDFRFVHINASVGIPAARLFIVYGVNSTERLPSLVGLAEAKRLLFSAQNIGAEEALRIGLADGLSNDPFRDAMDCGYAVAKKAPLSISGAKYILNSLAMSEDSLDARMAQAAIDRASNSHDDLEGRQVFAEKRLPDFKGC